MSVAKKIASRRASRQQTAPKAKRRASPLAEVQRDEEAEETAREERELDAVCAFQKNREKAMLTSSAWRLHDGLCAIDHDQKGIGHVARSLEAAVYLEHILTVDGSRLDPRRLHLNQLPHMTLAAMATTMIETIKSAARELRALEALREAMADGEFVVIAEEAEQRRAAGARKG